MELDQFIANVLNDVDKGLKQAREKTHRKYFIDVRDKNSVSFDIAVT